MYIPFLVLDFTIAFNVAMLKIVIWGYSNCDKIPVCRVLKSGKHRDFFGKHPVFFGKQMNGLGNTLLIFGKHLP
ncbi:hypothetical protein JCM6292_2519 [Bacteroides pyogenes JCM 6292]|uniref:Uncharacterized protein n=1 Tax=Bacteroides pyogenes JCM 6292 TaxID=1235809 RepID=W4P8S2_9BACE|nr:hypothetical protein JCM6292_2519 [Bacteroides pyogenes JCM 6292]